MKRCSASGTLGLLLLILAAHTAFCAQTKEKRLNLDLKKVPFPEVIRSIFSGSQDKYTVDPSLNDLRVSAALKNVTRDEAIRVVTRTAGVIYVVEKNTYTFKPDPQLANVRSTPVQSHSPAVMKGPTKVDMVTLRYISAGDAAALLNAAPPDGLDSITATSANTLMIKGNADSIKQARELIELFDVESVLPRSVRVVLSLKFTASGSESPVSLKTESVGPEGSPMPLSINYKSKVADSYNLDVSLTPSVLPDGSVSLTGSGGIECSHYLGTPVPESISKSFDVAASVTPGTPTVIASGSVETEGNTVEFTASVTVTVDKGRIVMPKGGLSTSGIVPGQIHQNAYRSIGAPKKPDESHRKAADALLQQVWNAQPGQPKFDAIDVVARKYMESDIATRNAIAWSCITYMKDKNRAIIDRWPCCYVISRSRYEQGVPDLADILLHDNVEVMRAVAAEALGELSHNNPSAYNALKQAERTENNARVREVLAKYLRSEDR